MPPGKSLSRVLALDVAMILAAAVPAAEVAWPRNSASDLSMVVALQSLQVRADHCAGGLPQLKGEFESAMENLHIHMQGISRGLLASDAFRDMEDKPVPAEIIRAFKDIFDDARHNAERQDASSVCPKTLKELREMDDESLRSALTQSLTAVRNMMQKLEKR
jgi:hypothetical protein